MAKKVLIGLIIVYGIFALSTLTLAQTTTTTPTTPTATPSKSKPIKPHRPFVGSKFKPTNTTTACYKEKVVNLTREMQEKKREALNEYKNALKSATSTAAKKEARKAYNSKIKEINNWYYQQLEQAKTECGIPSAKPIKPFKLRKHATTTQNVGTTSTSTATSTE